MKGKIGVFDSGFGGLTIFKAIQDAMPEYDYIYLGDNSRAPYGSKSFDTVYQYTWQAVQWLEGQGCHLIILACNTASARALRNIQQINIKGKEEKLRVLGIIRPTAEVIGHFSISKHIGIVGTEGTVRSNTYPIEIANFFPELTVTQKACPLWVPIIESDEMEIEPDAVSMIIKKDLQTLLELNPNIDTLLLGCTHYPIVQDIIQLHIPSNIKIINQAQIVAKSLVDYLKRNTEINALLGKNKKVNFFTTDLVDNFEEKASKFYGSIITADRAIY